MTSGPYIVKNQSVYMKTGDGERRISRADFPDSAEKFAAELNRQADVVRKIQKLVSLGLARYPNKTTIAAEGWLL